ncbi:MAG: hypothetical protein ACK5LL_00280 [Suipraeoptans sp.]
MTGPRKKVQLEVINVGQGDSLILYPPQGCNYEEEAICIDLGDGQKNITQFIPERMPVHIVLSHSHEDHIKGFQHFIPSFVPKSNSPQVRSLVLPLYQNESILIAKSLLNMNGLEEISPGHQY